MIIFKFNNVVAEVKLGPNLEFNQFCNNLLLRDYTSYCALNVDCKLNPSLNIYLDLYSKSLFYHRCAFLPLHTWPTNTS